MLADDHPAILDAVSRFLEDEPDIEIVGRAGTGQRALDVIAELEPDVALLDIQMPDMTGIEVARQLSAAGASTRTIIYTGYPERALLVEALDAGALGFVLKESPLQDVARAIQLVADGTVYVDASLAVVLASSDATERLPTLSARERQILRLLADGMRNDDVAAELVISPLTVRSHVRKAMAKLEADTRTQAVASALRQSLIA